MNKQLDIVRTGSRELALAGPGPMPRAPQVDRIDMRWILSTLARRRKLVIGITLAVLFAAIAFSVLKKPVYVAAANVVLNVPTSEIVPDAKEQQAGELSQDSADTEIQVLKSRDLASRAADTLLAKYPTVANFLIDPKPGVVGSLRQSVMGRRPVPTDPQERHEILVDALMSQATIQRTGTTFAVSIGFGASDPKIAALVANEIADTYTQGQFTDKRDQNVDATAFLAKRLEQLREQANADNASVQRYRIANNLLSTSGQSLTEQEISSYNQRVADARTDAAGAEAALATARSQLRSGSKGDDVGEAMSSSVIGGLRAQRAAASARLAIASARHGDLNPDVVKARSEVADIDDQISAEIKRVMSNLEAKVRVSQDRLAAISGSLSSARGTLAQNNKAGVELADLQRKADASQQLYESYLNRYKELSAKEGTEHSDARMISHAVAPGRPSSPNLPLNAALGLVIGLGLGIAAAFASEMSFSGLSSSHDVEHRLGLRYLGATPLMPGRNTSDIIDVPVEKPYSLMSNALRNLRSSIVYAAGDGARVFALASALPGEGKTATSIALARSIAVGGETCVVIDCDFRRRRMSRMVQVQEGAPGLVELLSGRADIEKVMIRDERSGAWLLPITSDSGEAARLLSGPAMNALLERLATRFDFVILDTPPILAVPEAREILAKADAVVMLTRWRKTPDHAVRTALRMLPSEFVRVIGMALTAVNVARGAGAESGDASFYYQQYRNYLTN